MFIEYFILLSHTWNLLFIYLFKINLQIWRSKDEREEKIRNIKKKKKNTQIINYYNVRIITWEIE